jgi:hypothetical protein
METTLTVEEWDELAAELADGEGTEVDASQFIRSQLEAMSESGPVLDGDDVTLDIPEELVDDVEQMVTALGL